MRLWYLHVSHRRPAKAQASLRIRTVSPEPSLFTHTKDRSRRRVRLTIRRLALLDGLYRARLKNVFMDDEKCHNLMSWLICPFADLLTMLFYHFCCTKAGMVSDLVMVLNLSFHWNVCGRCSVFGPANRDLTICLL